MDFIFILLFAITAVSTIPVDLKKSAFDRNYNDQLIATWIESLTSGEKQNAWELSGAFEGDIILRPGENSIAKNGVVNKALRWPGGVIPMFIEDNFDSNDRELIKEVLKEYHERTCLRFRPWNPNDVDYLYIKDADGCKSSVGRQGKGQLLNLQKYGCMFRNTIVHELLHAVGFYHQQSASNRDNYVTIHWENIQDDFQYAFWKYNASVITDYGLDYDYESIMHYAKNAFSKNGMDTITPVKPGVEIGIYKKLSEIDVKKVQIMYMDECGHRKPMRFADDVEIMLEDSVSWLNK